MSRSPGNILLPPEYQFLNMRKMLLHFQIFMIK